MSKRYKVVGPRTVLGTEPGNTIRKAIPDEQATALIAGGHIAEVKGESKGESSKRSPFGRKGDDKDASRS
jgi:hypothetical protein